MHYKLYPYTEWKFRRMEDMQYGLLSKRWRALAVALVCTLAFLYFWPISILSDEQSMPMELAIEMSHALPLPPIPYEPYHRNEQDAWLDMPKNDDQKYLFIANHVFHQGFGNALQEHVMNALLAYQSGRKLVVSNFTTHPDTRQEYVIEEFYGTQPVPSRIPWSAVLTGSIFVDIENKNPNPLHRPVSVRRYRDACPTPVMINSSIPYELAPDNEPQNRIPTWVDWMDRTHPGEKCLETMMTADRPFNFDCFASRNILKVFPLIKKSGILKDFGFSDIIVSIFENNIELFMNTKWRLPFWKWHDLGKTNKPASNLMVVHIRQGDWEQHCANVIQMWGFQGFNTFDEFQDGWVGPSFMDDRPAAMKRCFPSMQDMAEKIARVRTKEITHLYIMTNGSPQWVKSFKAVLYTTQKWKKISSTHDLMLTREQGWIAQAFDIYLGRRANVFIGNGWSSLTSSISLIRVHDDHVKTTRFW